MIWKELTHLVAFALFLLSFLCAFYSLLQRIIDSFQMDQCLIFCRTNFDCDQLELFLNELGGGSSGKKFRGKVEKGLENPYSCVVLAGARSMHERRAALQVMQCAVTTLPSLSLSLHHHILSEEVKKTRRLSEEVTK